MLSPMYRPIFNQYILYLFLNKRSLNLVQRTVGLAQIENNDRCIGHDDVLFIDPETGFPT